MTWALLRHNAAFYVGAVVRGELECAGLVDPSVAANHRTRAVRSIKRRVIGELIMRDRGIGPEGRHLNVADLTFTELDAIILRLLDSLVLSRPVAPAVPLDIAVRHVLLIPTDVAVHLRFSHISFQLLHPGR